jgi:hypothetical protein
MSLSRHFFASIFIEIFCYIYVYIKNKNQEYKRIDISYFLTISHLDLSPFRSQITSIKGKKHVFKNTTKDSEKW